ncbi:putative urea active transporter 1, partial [Pseudocercospora fuligena]
MADTFQISPPLSQGIGYGIVIGVGAAFAITMSAISWYLSRHMDEVQDTEMFMTAKHSVKAGLTASAVVSSWTIPATLLTSTSFGYSYGVSGPFWATGATIQILLFSVVAIELKRRAPYAQTFLQVIKARYGTGAHIVFSTYSLICQIMSTCNLLIGASAVFSAMTGINRDGSCFLLPIGVVHTVIIYIIMLMSIFIVYTTSSIIGSPGRMWTLLKEAAVQHPVSGNANGEYLTMRSEGGAYLGLVLVGAGFAGAVDSHFFQKAIAADPRSTSKGYLQGGLAWFTIPFVLASTYGLAAAAIEHLPLFPTYPNRMNAYEISSGMPMPYTALALMGTGGVFAVVLMCFMAVTSAMSSETVATTALLSYNVYKAYLKPDVTERELKRFSEYATVGFAMFVAALACGLNHAGFSVGFIVTAIGIWIDSAIIPMVCTIMWKKQSKAAVIISPLVGSAAGMIAWMLKAYTQYGKINITTLQGILPLVAGNMMALTCPIVVTPLITFIKPDNYDWTDLHLKIRPQEESQYRPSAHAIIETSDDSANDTLLRSRNISIGLSVVLTLALLVLWPIPMYATHYVFSEGFFTGWIVVVFLWAFFAAGTITLLPIWECRHTIKAVMKLLVEKKRHTADVSRTTLDEDVEQVSEVTKEKH